VVVTVAARLSLSFEAAATIGPKNQNARSTDRAFFIAMFPLGVERKT
jgi:hypothetical protein